MRQRGSTSVHFLEGLGAAEPFVAHEPDDEEDEERDRRRKAVVWAHTAERQSVGERDEQVARADARV